MLVSQTTRSCEFCGELVTDYQEHLRCRHKMVCGANTLVKCMFCLEQMEEVDMFSHVFYGHNISGMFFSSAAAGDGREKDVTTNTVSMQTEESPSPVSPLRVSMDHLIDHPENEESSSTSKHDEENTEIAAENEGDNQTYDLEEENLIVLDDDESDFELDSPLPDLQTEDLTDDCSTFHVDDEDRIETSHSQCQNDSESEVTLLRVTKSPAEEESTMRRAIQDTPEPEVTLINVAKTKSVKKKVTFSDVTNYYPIKKRRRSKWRAMKEPLILGANTKLKYLKYWGTTDKPSN